MGNPFSYHVSFRVTHPSLSAAEIAAGLGMSPKACWTAGDARVTPKGTPLGGVRDKSYCAFVVGEGEDGQLARCIDLGLSKLEATSDFLRKIRMTGGSLMFYAFWHPDGDTGEVFGVSLLRSLGDLGIELGINVIDDRGHC